MHLYILLRGIKHDIDRFITELQGKYLPFEFPNPQNNNKLEPGMLQVSVRPIQLYEIVFPEQHKDVMLNSILGEDKGKPNHRRLDKFVYFLRKILGIEKLPEYDNKQYMPIYAQNMEKIGIGIKKDLWINAKGDKFKDPSPEDKKKYELYEGI